MKLILITCSAKKRDGGSPEYSPSQLEGYLSKATFQRLLTLRSELAQTKHQPAGPDLGGNIPSTKLQYMPAYLRYSGIIYQRSNFAELFPRARGKKYSSSRRSMGSWMHKIASKSTIYGWMKLYPMESGYIHGGSKTC